MGGIAIINPQYVWVTSGLGKWTNEKGAEFLSKRSAGIDELSIVNVARLSNSNFYLVDEEEFKKRASNKRYSYMYGVTVQAPQGGRIYGDISALVTPEWSRVSYHTTDVTNRPIPEVPFSKKELMTNFERETGSISPTPHSCTVWTKSFGDEYYRVIVLAAMVIGEPE
jgi:hypothetical protein